MSSVQIRALSAALQTTACEQLFEVPDRLGNDLQALRAWLQQQPHLKARLDDQFLVAFLRGSKYSLEKAKQKVDNFYTLRTLRPDYYAISNANIDKYLAFVQQGVIAIQPKCSNHNEPRLCIVRLRNLNIAKFNMMEFWQSSLLMSEILHCSDDTAIIEGIETVVDCASYNTSILFQVTPTYCKNIVMWINKAMTLRLKAIHFVNTPATFAPILNMFKPLLPPKMQKRLHLHGSNMEELYKHIPQKYLPKEYGGENGSIKESIAEWTKRIESYREYYREEAQYGTDEKLRVGKPIDFQSMFGIEGSFRKLEVD